MNVGLLRIGVHYDQPVRSKKVSSMIQVYQSPGHHSGMMICLFRDGVGGVFWCSAYVAQAHNINIISWPVDSCPCHLLHPLDNKMLELATADKVEDSHTWTDDNSNFPALFNRMFPVELVLDLKL